MRLVPLNRGRMAKVSDRDYHRVRKFTWWESQGYAVRALPRRGKKNSPLQLMHVFIRGAGEEWDHRNGDGLDNRRCNLRRATHALNLANRGKPRGEYTSPFKGVCWHRQKGKWRAYLKVQYQQKHLGLFDDAAEAAKAYDRAAKKAYGSFARTNFSHRD